MMMLEFLPFFTQGEESFFDLVRDAAHWEFELFLLVLFDLVIGALVWPFIRRHIHRDVDTAERRDWLRYQRLQNRVADLEDKLGVYDDNP